MTYQERKAKAYETCKRANNRYRVDVRKLRLHLFPKGKIPLDYEDQWEHVKLPMNGWPRNEEATVITVVICEKSKSDGSRGMKGMRLYVICPECGKQISAGRLHQHMGYSH